MIVTTVRFMKNHSDVEIVPTCITNFGERHHPGHETCMQVSKPNVCSSPLTISRPRLTITHETGEIRIYMHQINNIQVY